MIPSQGLNIARAINVIFLASLAGWLDGVALDSSPLAREALRAKRVRTRGHRQNIKTGRKESSISDCEMNIPSDSF